MEVPKLLIVSRKGEGSFYSKLCILKGRNKIKEWQYAPFGKKRISTLEDIIMPRSLWGRQGLRLPTADK